MKKADGIDNHRTEEIIVNLKMISDKKLFDIESKIPETMTKQLDFYLSFKEKKIVYSMFIAGFKDDEIVFEKLLQYLGVLIPRLNESYLRCIMMLTLQINQYFNRHKILF